MTTHTDKIDAYLANADTTGKTVGDLAEDATRSNNMTQLLQSTQMTHLSRLIRLGETYAATGLARSELMRQMLRDNIHPRDFARVIRGYDAHITRVVEAEVAKSGADTFEGLS